MPKLNEEQAQQVAEASNSYDEGQYVMVLVSCDDIDPKTDEQYVSKSGKEFWKLMFEFPEDENGGKYAGKQVERRLYINKEAMSFVNQFFRAFGAETGTDTDAFLNKKLIIHMGTRKDEYDQDRPDVRMMLPYSKQAAAAAAGKSSPTGGKSAATTAKTNF